MNYKDLIDAIMAKNSDLTSEMFNTVMQEKASEAVSVVRDTVHNVSESEMSDEELGQLIIDEWTEEELEGLIEELVEELDLTEEQIDELSSATLGGYIKKANRKNMYHSAMYGGSTTGTADEKLHKRKMLNHTKGIEKATNKILGRTNEEQIDELSPKTLGSYIKKAMKEAGE